MDSAQPAQPPIPTTKKMTTTTTAPASAVGPPASGSPDRVQLAKIRPANNMSGPQSKRPRLPEDATAILKNFFKDTSRYPTQSQKDGLVAQIKAFPGLEGYDCVKLGRWFAGQRMTYKGTGKVESGGDHVASGSGSGSGKSHKKKKGSEMILFPSLTKHTIPSLEILLSETPNPHPQIIKIWADKLKAAVEDVDCWIKLRKVELENQGVDAGGVGGLGNGVPTSDDDVEMAGPAPSSHLPTPSESTSPEPNPASVKDESMSSPVLPRFVAAPLPPARRPTSISTMDVDPPPVHIPTSTRPAPPTRPFTISHQVRKALSSPSPAPSSTTDPAPAPTPLPKTTAEFNARFAPYENTIIEFLGMIDSGKLREFGFVPGSGGDEGSKS